MSKYRIKIEELNNGEKKYSPQCSKSSIVGGFVKSIYISWYNILQDGGRYVLSRTKSEWYENEEDALSAIDKYKSTHQYEEGKKVKSTIYKIVD